MMKNYTIFILAITVLLFIGCSSSKYVNYLEKNTEVIQASDSLNFTMLGKDFYVNNLFLVGEVHEVATSPRIDFAMFTQLNEKVNIDIYLAEMDVAQGYYLQQYIEGSKELELKEILKEWVVTIGSVSQQYRNKWIKMRAYYAQLSKSKQFELIGIDKITDFDLLAKLLKEKLPLTYQATIPTTKDELITWSEQELTTILEVESAQFQQDDLHLLQTIQFSLTNHKNMRSRDRFMHKNFKRYFNLKQWDAEKIYGGFGFAHTLQAYSYTLAGLIKKDTTLPYANKMVSMNTLYVDSRLTVDSRALPRFMQDKGNEFTRFKYSQDNRLFMYIQGIADYKKVTKPNTISLLKLDAANSPYLHSNRGTKMKKLITIWDGFDPVEGAPTTAYAQYIFLVRNADWIKPD